jgi:hypothetical protein
MLNTATSRLVKIALQKLARRSPAQKKSLQKDLLTNVKKAG